MLSMCLIALNEEHNIRRCIESHKGIYDELILIDTGSKDRTKEIAAELGAKVYDFNQSTHPNFFNKTPTGYLLGDFSAVRNFSFSKATKQYIYWCDLDDVLPPESYNQIKKLKEVNELIFDIESWGQIPVKEIFLRAIDALDENLEELNKLIK